MGRGYDWSHPEKSSRPSRDEILCLARKQNVPAKTEENQGMWRTNHEMRVDPRHYKFTPAKGRCSSMWGLEEGQETQPAEIFSLNGPEKKGNHLGVRGKPERQIPLASVFYSTNEQRKRNFTFEWTVINRGKSKSIRRKKNGRLAA